MSLTAVVINNASTLGTGATPANPVTGTQFLPVATSSLVGNAVAFNFILTSGSVSPGANASANFRYGFSMTSYSNTNAPAIVYSSIHSIRFPSTPSTTLDYTTALVVPITGNYLYTWFDLNGPIYSPVTITVNAVPIAVTNSSIPK